MPRPSLLLGCKARSTQRSQPPIRRWSSIASRRTVPPPLAGRGWLPPPADELNGWETGGGFSSSSDEEDEDDLDLFPDEVRPSREGSAESSARHVVALHAASLRALSVPQLKPALGSTPNQIFRIWFQACGLWPCLFGLLHIIHLARM